MLHHLFPPFNHNRIHSTEVYTVYYSEIYKNRENEPWERPAFSVVHNDFHLTKSFTRTDGVPWKHPATRYDRATHPARWEGEHHLWRGWWFQARKPQPERVSGIAQHSYCSLGLFSVWMLCKYWVELLKTSHLLQTKEKKRTQNVWVWLWKWIPWNPLEYPIINIAGGVLGRTSPLIFSVDHLEINWLLFSWVGFWCLM